MEAAFRIAHHRAVPAARAGARAASCRSRTSRRSAARIEQAARRAESEPRRRATVRRGTPGVRPADGEVAVFAAPSVRRAAGARRCSPAGAGRLQRRRRARQSAPTCWPSAKRTLDARQERALRARQHGRPDTGTVLTGGEGDIARPASFQGTLKVHALGSGARPQGRSRSTARSTRSCRSPPSYSRGRPRRSSASVTPARCSTPTPASPSCSRKAESAKLGDEKRVGGEVVREVTAEIPGDLVEQILTSKDPSKPVQARFSIATEDRRAAPGRADRAVLRRRPGRDLHRSS